MTGNFGLIDEETPQDAYTKLSWADGKTKMQLVFSDEFNTDGRSFYPGDDPYWEAVDLHYWVSQSRAKFYDPKFKLPHTI
jgi:beta-glucanase (GH16 family)